MCQVSGEVVIALLPLHQPVQPSVHAHQGAAYMCKALGVSIYTRVVLYIYSLAPFGRYGSGKPQQLLLRLLCGVLG